MWRGPSVRPPAARRDRVLAMTDTETRIAHLVTDEAMAAGRRAGRYVAACTTVVVPGSLKEDTNRYCRACQQWMVARCA